MIFLEKSSTLISRSLLSAVFLLVIFQASPSAASTCSHRFYLDDLNQWNQCEVGCQTCSSELNCTSCDLGYYQNSTSCLICDSQCLTCTTNSTNCVTCDPLGYTPYLSGTSCVAACSSSQWLNGTQCQACSSNCLSCSGSPTFCTACQGNEVLKDGACMVCPSGHFNNNGTCQACGPTCSECVSSSACTNCSVSFPYYLPSTQTCLTSCPAGTYASGNNTCLACDTNCVNCTVSATNCTACELELELTSANTCVLPQCPQGQYNATGTCTACDSNCDLCVNNATNCYFCNPDGANPILNLQNNTCVASCPIGTYSDQENCPTCDPSCVSCATSADNCTACASTPPLTISGLNTCATSCPAGQFNNTNVCSGCHSSCATCDGPLISNCTSCSGTSVLIGGVCQTCPPGQYSSNNTCVGCPSHCLTCSSANVCLSCNSTFFFDPVNGNCTLTCPNGTYPDSSRVCQACPSMCGNCSSATTCTSCNLTSSTKKFNPVDASCSQQCPSGTWDNNNHCEACNSTCLTCSGSSTNCTSCNQGSTLALLNTVNNTCVQACPSGSFRHQASCFPCCSPCHECSSGPLNCTACSSSSSFPFLNATTNTCLASCPTGTWNNNSVCVECPQGCSACSSASSCSSCFDGFYFSGGSCLPCSSICATCNSSPTDCIECSPETYPSNQGCVPCISPCVTCSSQTDCDSCIANTYLGDDQQTCLSCPTGQFYSGTACEFCDPACAACSLGTTNNCTACNPGFYLDGTSCLTCAEQCSQCSGPTSAQCSACNNGFFISGSTCTNCISPCLTCSSSTQCDSCVIGYFKQGSSCEQCNPACRSCSNALPNSCASCAHNYYQPIATTSCLACDLSCNGCSNSGNAACSSCASGYFNSSGICNQCHSTCTECSGILSTNCTECSASTFLQPDGSCQGCVPFCIDCTGASIADCVQCQDGYFISQSACQQCDPSCKNCAGNTASDCAECATGFSLHLQTCLAQCPQGYTSVDSICELCPSGNYIYQGVCLRCPTTTAIPDQQLSAALVSCEFTTLTPSEETKLINLVTADLSTHLNNSTKTNDEAQDLINKIKNVALSISSQINHQTQTFILRKFPISTQQTVIDTGSQSNGVQVSLKLDNSIGLQSGNVIGAVFRQPVFNDAVITPTFDLNLEVSGSQLSVSNANTEFSFQFSTIPAAASNGMRCVYWNVTSNSWESNGVVSSASGNTVTCTTSHFTSFSVIEDPNGVSFGSPSESPYFIPLYLGIVLFVIVFIAMLTDCFVLRRKANVFPHQNKRGVSFCKVFRYSFLYNFLFVNIWGFKSRQVCSTFKALWTTSMIWIVVIVFTILFQIEPSQGKSYYPVISILCGLLLLPNSLLHCCLIKYSKEKQSYHPARQQSTSKDIKPRELRIEMEQPPQTPAAPQTPPHKDQPSETGRMNIFEFSPHESTSELKHVSPVQYNQVYNRVGVALLIIFTTLAWISGIVLSIILHPEIHKNSEKAYQDMGLGIALTLPIGMIMSLVKILISVAVAICYKQKHNKCCYSLVVDLETTRIVHQLNQGSSARKRVQTRVESPGNDKDEQDPDCPQFMNVIVQPQVP